MLDGLSLIASVITLIAAITESVKYARTFYRAPEELGALQAGLDISISDAKVFLVALLSKTEMVTLLGADRAICQRSARD